VNPYLKLVRIHNVIGAAIGDFTGYVVSSAWNFNLEKLIISLIVVSLVAAGGYAINDVYDVEIDKINKPDRPLPSGRISIKNAVTLSYSTMIIGSGLAFILGILQGLLAILTSIALIYYAKTLKRQGLPGNIIVATTTALSIFYGGIAYFEENWFERVIIPTAYSFLLTLGRELVKGIEDYEGDKKYGVRTLATTKGIRFTWNTARVILLLMLAISPLPILLGFNIIYGILLIPFTFFTLKAMFAETSPRGGGEARGLLKGSAFIGMIAFILGSLPFKIFI
jgi:geranylgeranylglycerol-phosphate geranylgeranyltransferase